jgi:hypothetical protein
MNRDIESVHCKCGGTVDDVETTDEEEKAAGGCPTRGCCVRVFECERCKARFVFRLEAPECGWEV